MPSKLEVPCARARKKRGGVEASKSVSGIVTKLRKLKSGGFERSCEIKKAGSTGVQAKVGDEV